MTDVGALLSLGTSLKTAADILTSLLDLSGRAASTPEVTDELVEALRVKIREVEAELLEARRFALEAQADQFALTDRIRNLETQVMKHDDWAAERARYMLHEPAPGAFVYALKPGEEMGEPPHWACTRCMEQQRKSVLQMQRPSELPMVRTQWLCPACDTAIGVWG